MIDAIVLTDYNNGQLLVINKLNQNLSDITLNKFLASLTQKPIDFEEPIVLINNTAFYSQLKEDVLFCVSTKKDVAYCKILTLFQLLEENLKLRLEKISSNFILNNQAFVFEIIDLMMEGGQPVALSEDMVEKISPKGALSKLFTQINTGISNLSTIEFNKETLLKTENSKTTQKKNEIYLDVKENLKYIYQDGKFINLKAEGEIYINCKLVGKSRDLLLKLEQNKAIIRYNNFFDKIPDNDVMEFKPSNGIQKLLVYSVNKTENEGLIPLLIERKHKSNKTSELIELIITVSYDISNLKIEIPTIVDFGHQISANCSSGKATFDLDKTVRLEVPYLSSKSTVILHINSKGSDQERIFDIFHAYASFRVESSYSNIKVQYMNIINEAAGEKFQKGIKYSTLCNDCVFRYS